MTLETAAIIIDALNPFGSIIKKLLERTSAELPNNPQELPTEVARREASLELGEAQARILRELAIARRIDTAEEVEIEEYLDVSGKGNAGVATAPEGLTVGLSGSGQRIVKRVYKFKGWREGGLDSLRDFVDKASPEDIQLLQLRLAEELQGTEDVAANT